MQHKFLIAGAGFSGAVLANQLEKELDCTIDVWDERSHVAGNCHTKRDAETNVMVHEYGPHIFNTDKKEIWDFVNSFVEFIFFINRVREITKEIFTRCRLASTPSTSSSTKHLGHKKQKHLAKASG